MKLLVSACLLGARCRYDGGSKPCPQVIALTEGHILIPICPEQLGGLPTPRPPAEIQGTHVRCQDGREVTEAYQKGAAEALRMGRTLGCQGAILKSRSPSCGAGQVYDGSFSGCLRPGMGVTAQALKDQGFPLWTEENCHEIPLD